MTLKRAVAMRGLPMASPIALSIVSFLVMACALVGTAGAQDSAAPAVAASAGAGVAAGPLVRVFLDCDSCDETYLRQNVGFVDYVRDRTDADFHVLVTTEGTGGGGLSWVLQFIGIGHYQGQDHRLTFNTPSATTSDERRTAFARVFKLGLATAAAATSAASQLDVTWKKPATGVSVMRRDPWNYWVFSLNANGNIDGERSSSSRSNRVNVSANRTTNNWKLGVNANGNLRRNTFVLDETQTIKSETSSWNVNGRAVKSLATRWAVGATGSVSHSSYSNVNRGIGFAPAIEFDVFPYSESSRRLLTIQYAAGVTANRYSQLTVYDKLSDTLPRHAVIGSLSLRQPWGSMEMFSQLSQHLSHLDRYHAEVYAQTDVRLFRGFSFNVFAEYSKIKDQISLRKDDASAEDVLLRLRQLATGYSYSLNFGVSYRFGSIFNNIVNPRFGNTSF